jgi:predicted nuclease of predicted toxin-antitoxin system
MSRQFAKLVVDENVPKQVVDMLKGLELKEVYWISEHKAGISDPEIWLLAAGRQYYLLSGDIRFFK